MRTFDDLCLIPIEAFTPQQIVELRLREHASQAVCARYLNVTPSTVSQWERGAKRPRRPSSVMQGRRRTRASNGAQDDGFHGSATSIR